MFEGCPIIADGEIRSLLEIIYDGMAVLRGHRLLHVNAAAARLLGYETRSELVSRSLLDFVAAEHRPSVHEVCVRPPGQTTLAECDVVLLPRDGRRVHVRVVQSAVLPFEGAQAVVITLRDLSECYKAQEQLLLSDRLASIGMLTAGVAHELNNPLGTLIGNLELAQECASQIPSSSGRLTDLREELADAREAAQRLRAIVLDLKQTACVPYDAMTNVDVHRVLDSSLRLARAEVRNRAQIVKEYAAASAVRANEARLGQVFLNLIINAAQAIPAGQPECNYIRLATRDRGAGVVVEISDTGGGIAPEHMPRLFTQFFTTKPPGIGTGLGLSICKRILTQLGGEISVSSERAKGTTFSIILPAAVPTSPAVPQDAA